MTSAMRDRFLSLRELEKVTTILIAMDTGKVQANIVRDFLLMLEQHGRSEHELRNCILTAVNRFDMLVPPRADALDTAAVGVAAVDVAAVDAAAIDAAAVDAAALEPAAVIAASEDLATAWSAASELVRGQADRVVLCSSVAAIGSRQVPGVAPVDDRIRVDGMSLDGLSERELDRIGEAIGTVRDRARFWSRTSERMRRAAPDDRLAALLDGFTTDGGFTELRVMIERHVTEHGGDLRVRRMRAGEAELVAAMRRLCRAIRAVRGRDGDEVATETDILIDLISTAEAALDALTASAKDFRSPSRPKVEGRPLLEAVEADAVAQVFEWRQWRELRPRVRNAIVNVGAGGNRAGVDGDPFDDPFAEFFGATAGDDSTGPFIEEFAATVQHVISGGERMLRSSLEEWAADREAETAALRAKLADPEVLHALTDRMIAADPAHGRDRVAALTFLATPERLVEILRMRVSKGGDRALVPAELFPLRADHKLPWHPDRDRKAADDADSQTARHQINVFRMRRELACAVSRAATGHLAATLADLARLVDQGASRVRTMMPAAQDVRRAELGVSPGAAGAAESPVCALVAQWKDR
jgi:hypothetical protein